MWRIGGVSFPLTILADAFSWLFLTAVIIITFRVLLFSYSYIKGARGFSKFHLLVLAFVASIVALVLRPNVVTLMLGWDGLGISSFFLVIFYKSNKALNAGFLTALTNRLGDALILVSLTMLSPFSSFTIFRAARSQRGVPVLIGLVIIIAACTKRAQVPFRAWLPAAMAAPTPVSALVHSSTLVTAGVYLLFRLAPLLEHPFIAGGLGGLGAATSVIARLGAFLESDLKKIVALSTLSQLGVIVLRLSLNIPSLAFFHLIVHAFFKALLFIATGRVIHNSNDYQDFRRNGGVSLGMPFSQAIIILTKIRLCGLPFFSAFYSKEWVLERLSRGGLVGLRVYIRIWIGVLFTGLYSLRFIFYIRGAPRTAPLFWKTEWDPSILIAKLGLVAPGVITGKCLLPHIIRTLSLPIVSGRAKVMVLLILFIWAPFLFSLFPFISPSAPSKSLFYLLFLRSWRGLLPMVLTTHASFSRRWNNRFGWKDLLLLSWGATPSRIIAVKRGVSWPGLLKSLAVSIFLFIVWALF